MREQRKKMIKQHRLCDRIKPFTSNSLILDETVIYNFKGNYATTISNKKFYRMKNFQHFLDVFVYGKTAEQTQIQKLKDYKEYPKFVSDRTPDKLTIDDRYRLHTLLKKEPYIQSQQTFLPIQETPIKIEYCKPKNPFGFLKCYNKS